MDVTALSGLAPVAALLPANQSPAPAPNAPTAAGPQVVVLPTLEITYDFNRELNQIIFTLRRPDTGQVVKQVPPRAVLEFAVYILHKTTRAVDVKI